MRASTCGFPGRASRREPNSRRAHPDGDFVGVSTVPEVILARRAGLRCAAVSVVTNYAAGSLAVTRAMRRRKTVAHEAADRFKRLLRGFIRSYRSQLA